MKNLLFHVLLVFLITILFSINVYAYQEYKIGDEINYQNEKYYVIENSDSSSDYIVLLKDSPLTVEQLYQYGRDENDHLFINEYTINGDDPEKVVFEDGYGNGEIAFYTSDTCGYEYNWKVSSYENKNIISDGCTNDYNNSDVKKVIDNWASSFEDDLIEVNDYKARLLNLYDLRTNLGFKYLTISGMSFSGYTKTDYTPNFLLQDNYSYWIMAELSDKNYETAAVGYDFRAKSYSVSSFNAVRPVINLKKCALDNSCSQCSGKMDYTTILEPKYKKYQIGEEIEYHGNIYYVVNQINQQLILLKKDSLSENEINLYSNGLYSSTDVPYYISDTCMTEDNITGCSNSFEDSNIWNIINKWAEENINKNDLYEINGNNIRVLNTDDLVYSLGYISITSSPYIGYLTSYLTPSWVIDYKCWIMDFVDDTNSKMFSIGESYLSQNFVFDNRCIRPVIHLNSCSLDGGCYEEGTKVKICINDDTDVEEEIDKTKEKGDQVVNVDDTFRTISYILCFISLILIISGIFIVKKVYLEKNNK